VLPASEEPQAKETLPGCYQLHTKQFYDVQYSSYELLLLLWLLLLLSLVHLADVS
jgi:hypothetical protein